jgi:hypothetical protein
MPTEIWEVKHLLPEDEAKYLRETCRVNILTGAGILKIVEEAIKKRYGDGYVIANVLELDAETNCGYYSVKEITATDIDTYLAQKGGKK